MTITRSRYTAGHTDAAGAGQRTVYDDLARTVEVVERRTGTRPRRMRAPYGVFTTPALLAARRLDLEPVLWTCWGRTWTPQATSASVASTVLRGLAGGGTILLHDSDVASAPGSWRATLVRCPGCWTAAGHRGSRSGR